MTASTTLNRARALLLSPAIAALALAGCGGSSPEQQAITEAAAAMHGMGFTGGTPLPAPAKRAEHLQKLITSLKPAVDSSNPGEASAASGLIARAQAGLAEIAAAAAADAEHQALAQTSNIRAAFDQWVNQRAIAASLQSHDATPELAALDRKIGERQAEAARAVEARDRQAALVAQVRAKAEQARAQARQFRDQEAAIRAGAASGSQTQRAAALEQAMVVKRQGDAYEMEAAGFEAEAASLAPEVDTLQAAIDKLNRQVELLREAKRATSARAEASKAQAAAAQAEADAGARRVSELLAGLAEAREATVEPTERAAKLYSTAIAAAKKSGGSTPSSKSAANMAAGNIQQSLGDLLADKARGQGVYAKLMAALAAGGQPGVTAEQAAQAAKSHADAVAAAEESYKSAIASFESAAGGGGDIKERIERVTSAMKRLVRAEEPPPAPPADASAPPAGDAPVEKPVTSSPGGTAEFDPAAVTAEVKQVLAQLHADVGDEARAAESMSQRFHAADPAIREFTDAAIGLTRGKFALDAACRSKYGKDLQALIAESRSASVKANPMFMMLGTAGDQLTSQLKSLDPATAQITATSATAASVAVDASPMPMQLVKVDGAWKLSLDNMFPGDAGKQMIAMMKEPLGALSKAFADITGKIESGAFADAEAMLLELNKQLLMAMPRGRGPGAAPPGGGGG